MGEIKIKYIEPKATELDLDDIIINVTSGDIFYKDKQGRLNAIQNRRPATSGAASQTSFGGAQLTEVDSIVVDHAGIFGSITCSGDISASGTIYGNNFASTGEDANGIDFKDDVVIDGTIQADNLSGTNTGDQVIPAAVTLAGTPDYITISNQEITRNQIDLTSDVTGLLPDANLSANTAHLDTTQTFSGTKTFSAATTTFGNITTTGGVTGTKTGSFGRIECMMISSSIGIFDASTIFLGGTDLNKSDLDNLKQGKSIIPTANKKSIAARGQAEAEDNNVNYIRPTLIMHPTDDESALIHKTAGRLHFRCVGGDPFEIFCDGSSNDKVRLGSTTTNATEIKLHGSISASIDGGLF